MPWIASIPSTERTFTHCKLCKPFFPPKFQISWWYNLRFILKFVVASPGLLYGLENASPFLHILKIERTIRVFCCQLLIRSLLLTSSKNYSYLSTTDTSEDNVYAYFYYTYLPITNWSSAAKCSDKNKKRIQNPSQCVYWMVCLISLNIYLFRDQHHHVQWLKKHTENSELYGVMNVFYQDHWGHYNFLKFLELNLQFRSLTDFWLIQTSYSAQHACLNIIRYILWSHHHYVLMIPRY